jgi:threonylcarbamoyladenosine tRNA methylthiotransferase MtaB
MQKLNQNPSTNQVITFGCRLNTYESEVIKDLSGQAGLQGAIIINTCAVTAEAERQARQAIRRLRRENPDAEIIVTGCGAQINPKQYSDMPEVTSVIGNDEKMKLMTYQSLKRHDAERVLVNDIMSVTETAGHLVSGFEGKARAFVQVQNGCDHRCTFCTIPYGRGNSRSVPLGEIVNQIRQLIIGGYQEVVLTGVDITSYGGDLPGNPTLGQMIKRLLAMIPELKRLRLSSLDPVEIDQDLWRLIAEEDRLMPHLHVSLQAGDDMILKRMKRRHLRKDVVEFCRKARDYRPDIVFGADLIAGFPTETDEMFENTYKIIDECDLTFLHIFPYSAREGTPASRMPQVPKAIIKERAARLRQAGEVGLDRFYDKWVGRHSNLLIESVAENNLFGKTDHFAPVRVESSSKAFSVGSLIEVKLTGREKEELMGVLV